MDIWALIVGLAVIIGIAAGIVQILQYMQERREKKQKPTAEEVVALSPPVPAIPSNLPPRGEFIGREKEKARVREALASRWPLTCIDGFGGIGKTALALEVAGECLRASKGEIPANGTPTFDGFIWTTAKDRELTLNDILDAVARTLDYLGIAQQPFEEKQESIRKLLQTKPYLLIVDNFETVMDDAVRDFLLRLPEPTKVLITSREQKLRQAWAVSLKGLEQAEALTLIRSEGRRLGLESVEKGEERVLLHLYQATGGAPLAIKWAVGQIKQKGQSLDTVLAALHEARGDIFEDVFARSWSLLTDEARRILMVMPIFVASASRAAIEAASDVHYYALDEGLGQLVEMWLLEVSEELDEAKRRYSIHPLTRAFAGRKLGEDTEWERDTRKRAAIYFLNLATQCGGDNWRGYPVLESELDNLLDTMHWCYQVGEWRILIDFIRTLERFFYVYSYWRERMHYANQARRASQELQDERSLAFTLILTAWTLHYQGKYEEAAELAREAGEISRSLNDEQGKFDMLLLLGATACRQGECERASQLLNEALAIAQTLESERCIIYAKTALVDTAYECKDYDEARRQLDEILKTKLVVDDPYRLAPLIGFQGSIALAQGKYEKAKKFFDEALTIHQKTGRQIGIAYEKRGLALVEEGLGNPVVALELANEALPIFERWGTRKHVEETRKIVGRLEKKVPGGSRLQ